SDFFRCPSSERRWETSISSPRREWLSFLCVLKCSVRFAIRSDRIATCTSADPVSASPRAWVRISSALRSAVIDIGYLRSGELKDPHGIEPSRTHLAERHDPLPLECGDGARASDEPRLQRLHLTGKKDDRASLHKPEGVFGGQGRRRDVVQRGLDRKQGLQAGAAMTQLFQLFQ